MTVDVCYWDLDEASLPQRAQPHHIAAPCSVVAFIVLVCHMHACTSVFACACLEARGQLIVASSIALCLTFGDCLSLNSELAISVRMSVQWAPRLYPFLHTLTHIISTGVTDTCHCASPLHVRLGMQAQVHMLAQSAYGAILLKSLCSTSFLPLLVENSSIKFTGFPQLLRWTANSWRAGMCIFLIIIATQRHLSSSL